MFIHEVNDEIYVYGDSLMDMYLLGHVYLWKTDLSIYINYTERLSVTISSPRIIQDNNWNRLESDFTNVGYACNRKITELR